MPALALSLAQRLILDAQAARGQRGHPTDKAPKWLNVIFLFKPNGIALFAEMALALYGNLPYSKATDTLYGFLPYES